MSALASPYAGLESSKWKPETRKLVKSHPLDCTEIVAVVQGVWADIFKSGIGTKPFRIGEDLFPKPQIMAFFLHE